MTDINLPELMKFVTAMRSLMENSTDFILISDREAKPIYFNKAYAEIMGTALGIEMVPGLAPHKLLSDPEAIQWWNDLHARVLSGETFSIEYAHHFKDDDVRYFEFNYTPIWKNGEVNGFVEISRDISERKQTEALLRHQTALLETILENIPVMISLFDISGRPRLINRCFQETLNCSPERINDPHVWEAFYPDPHYRQHVFDYIHASKGTWDNFKTHTLDGQVLDTLWANVPLQDGLNIGLGIDITDYKHAKEQLAHKEDLLNSLANTVEDSIFCKDKDRRYTFVNKAMANLLGCSEDYLIGKTPEEVFDVELAAIVKEVDDRTFNGQRVSEVSKLNIGGNIYYLHTIQMPMIVEAGEVISINGIVRDVTKSILDQEEKRNLETKLAQAIKMQAVGTLAGGIAHEFNNLLSVIMGCAELARMEVPKNSFVDDQLDSLLKASYRVKDLVKQILTFSRQGQQKKKSCRLCTLIQESLKLVRTSIPASVDIKVDIDRDIGNVNVDPTEIQQIIMNLCSNAVWAMKEKGTIAISLHQIQLSRSKTNQAGLADGTYIELVFSDTGVGMDDEIQNKIFDPFFTCKGAGEGTGMGLSITNNIMLSYGGAITVESELGKGTTLHLFFPVTEDPVSEEENPVEDIPKGHEHILFVDDQQMVAKMCEKMISRLGYTVNVYTDSLKAIDAFKANPDAFDLVITDQIMPGFSGEELVKELRALRSDIPIILCTGYSTQIDEEKSTTLGINAFAYKPLERKDIARLIRTVLDEKRS